LGRPGPAGTGRKKISLVESDFIARNLTPQGRGETQREEDTLLIQEDKGNECKRKEGFEKVATFSGMSGSGV